MEIIADLHLHSKYSRAVSPQMVIPEIAKWARRKGIGLVGAPDWTHPLWLRELKENLEEVGEGVYKIKSSKLKVQSENVYFLLSTEISSIFSQHGRSHRIHNLVLAPSFSVVEKINNKLRSRGVNLLSDGRPITGLSSIELCELVFSVAKDCLVIPCHVWTPWFSLYGSRSGFDSIGECFQDMSKYIYAIETGLSSSPDMNWRIKELDSRSIASFSDAHSGAKLGREATVFEMKELSFKNVSMALRSATAISSPRRRYGNSSTSEEPLRVTVRGVSPRILYTIEFYPEEGKYHYTGHRNCGVKHSPEETKKLGETCPVCGRPLTVGVMQRVEELATRSAEEVKIKEVEIENGLRGVGWQNRPPYVMLVPLMEILAEALGSGVSSQIVETEYNRLIREFGSEFNVLLKASTEEVGKIAGERVAEGIFRVRSREVVIDPGYDGVFGTVKIWPSSIKALGDKQKQMSLF